jgi:hypothetical protein
MVVILGNAGSTPNLTLAVASGTPAVTVNNDTCIGGVDPTWTGYQECEFRFPPTHETTPSRDRFYQHFHRETWEIVGLDPLGTATGTNYNILWTWMEGGQGTSYEHMGNDLDAEWKTKTSQVETKMHVYQTIQSGQPVQAAESPDARKTARPGIASTQRQAGRPADTSDQPHDEYAWPKRVSPPLPQGPTRVEGFSTIGAASYGWPGVNQLSTTVGNPTISCRWSFPVAP